MAISTVNIGSAPNDGTGDPLRTAFNKLNTNFLNITADGGDEITVTDPTTSTDGTLNDALANIYASGSTPDLQEVTDENLNVDGYAETTNGIQTSKLIAEYFKVDSALEYFDYAGPTPNFYYSPSVGLIIQDDAQENGVSLYQSGLFQISKNGFSTELESTATTSRLLFLPDKDGTLATTDDIPTLDATPTNGSTNGVESNGVFDALALKLNLNRFVSQAKTSITGVTGESNICSFKIDGGAYASTDGFKFDFTQYKGTTGSTITYRAYIGTTSGARTNQILSTAITGANRTGDVTRRYYIDGGNLDCGVPFTTNAQSGLSGFSTVNTPISVNMANDLWITITAQGQTSGETVGILGASITPLK